MLQTFASPTSSWMSAWIVLPGLTLKFEIVSDGHLHVNVTHKYPTRTARGWAGPASLPEGFVHNRTFGDTQPSQIIRHVRDMVFAARI